MFTTVQIKKKWAKMLKQMALDREKPLWQILDEILKQALQANLKEEKIK